MTENKRSLWRALRCLIALLLIAAAEHGCNAGGSHSNSSAAQAYENSERRQLELICTCETEDLCVEARLSDRFDSCARDAVDVPSAAATLDCTRQATDRETQCLEGDPCDSTRRDDCFQQWVADTDECPPLPDDVQKDLDSCPDLFECVDGDTIDYSLVCDGNEDCNDGSDEVPC